MIIRDFPDFGLSGRNPDAPCQTYGFPNAFILIKGNELYYPEHAGPLSILCNFNGTGEYILRKQRFLVDDSSYLILNDGQRFANSVRSDTAVESFHIWFHSDFAARVLRDIVTPSDKLLDDPDYPTQQPVRFFERTYPHDSILTPRLMDVRERISEDIVDESWENEQFHLLLEQILEVHRNVAQEIGNIPGVRQSTRVEIYRRLHEARDFIDANIGEKLSLERMAGVAFMSSHHFLRLFRHVFGITPHQYLTQRRLERACKLLAETSLTVAEICKQVGFISHGSFSWMFRRRLGNSPEGYRQIALRGEE